MYCFGEYYRGTSARRKRIYCNVQNTVALVRLGRIVKNAELVKKRSSAPLIAVVKDDGYGHGAEAVANALNGSVSAFAVSSVEEGASLRIAGIAKDILVLSPPINVAEAEKAALYGLTATVSSFVSLRFVKQAAQSGRAVKAHFAVNTGMNRYGFRPSLVRRACEEAEGIAVTGVYSHFYLPESERAREEQYGLFCSAANTVRQYFPEATRHLSATGGILAGRKYRFDAVRCGIALYGYLPAGFEGALAVKPAMSVYAPVAQCASFTGGGAGYAKAEKTYGKLHTLRFGYGDGFFREGYAIGRLCMDACVCEGKAGTGTWKKVLTNAAEYAAAHGTSAYEVLTCVGGRAVKIYV